MSQNQWVQKVTVWILLEVTSLQINLLPVEHSLPQFGVPYNTGIPNWRKMCSTGQKFIRKEVTSYNIHFFVMSQRSVNSCTRWTRANAFSGGLYYSTRNVLQRITKAHWFLDTMQLFLIDPNVSNSNGLSEPSKNIDSFDTMHLFLVDPNVANSFCNP